MPVNVPSTDLESGDILQQYMLPEYKRVIEANEADLDGASAKIPQASGGIYMEKVNGSGIGGVGGSQDSVTPYISLSNTHTWVMQAYPDPFPNAMASYNIASSEVLNPYRSMSYNNYFRWFINVKFTFTNPIPNISTIEIERFGNLIVGSANNTDYSGREYIPAWHITAPTGEGKLYVQELNTNYFTLYFYYAHTGLNLNYTELPPAFISGINFRVYGG